MNQETVTYLTNIVIGVILAGLTTHYWWHQRQPGALRFWLLSAWVMTFADMLFAARPILPPAVGRLLPTLCVTIGQAGLWLGAQHTAGLRRRWDVAAAILAVHAAGLTYFLLLGQPTHWRMVFNGLIWGGLAIASARALRRAPWPFWKSAVAPAMAFLVHGVFHGLRVALAILFKSEGWATASASLEILGDLEVSFFMVALFVGLLVAHLQLRHEELSRARAEVQTLSGLLPICAWCKKVRDDEGYWQQVEEYFCRHSSIRFTHGVCADCLEDVKEREGITQ